MEIAALGTSETMLGFQLAGIRKTIVAEEPEAQIKKLAEDQNIGIIIIDDETFNTLDELTREKIRNLVKPAFVVVSRKAENEDLRMMVKKSIGIDLWEQK